MIIVLKQLGDCPVSKVQSVEYHMMYEKEYREKFEYYKSKGIFMDSRFEDKTWVALTGVNRNTINFNMNEVQFNSAKRTNRFSVDFNFKL